MSSKGAEFFTNTVFLMVAAALITFMLGGIGGGVGRNKTYKGTPTGKSLEHMQGQFSGWGCIFFIIGIIAIIILSSSH